MPFPVEILSSLRKLCASASLREKRQGGKEILVLFCFLLFSFVFSQPAKRILFVLPISFK
jgi:hypothetical protein